MRVIESRELSRWERRRRQAGRVRQWRKRMVVLLMLAGLVGIGYIRFHRSLPTPYFEAVEIPTKKHIAAINWPAFGQSAVGSVDGGLLAKTDNQKAVPIASVAKTITVLTVLQKKPLRNGEHGPQIMLTAADEALYHQYVSVGGSVSGVTAGKTITEYEAIQTLMLPSSNNMADTLANWAFGSQQAYLQAADAYVKSLGMQSTTVADASGFSPQTVSTAEDMVLLGIEAMKYPALAEIVRQPSANIGVAGVVQNVNQYLGTDGLVGIKTGNTDQAGGCFLAAAERVLADGKKHTIVGVVLGAPDRKQAIRANFPLLSQTAQQFSERTIIQANQQVGWIKSAWGEKVSVVSEKSLRSFGWPSEVSKVSVSSDIREFSKGSPAGVVTAKLGATDQKSTVRLSETIKQPTFSWRFKRIFTF